MVLITALQRKLRRKAVAKLCEWPSSRSVSDSSRYIRSRAQYAARRLVLVKVDLPKGTGGLTGHAHASQSHDGAARTGWDGGGWRVAVFRSVNSSAERAVAGRARGFSVSRGGVRGVPVPRVPGGSPGAEARRARDFGGDCHTRQPLPTVPQPHQRLLHKQPVRAPGPRCVSGRCRAA